MTNNPFERKQDNTPREDRIHKRSDVDSSPQALHHTLGPGESQAAPGSHKHGGSYTPIGSKKSYSIHVHVKDFGAVGDKVTDDTKAIQRAINAVFKNYGVTDPPLMHPITLTGEGGIYRVGSLDLTDIRFGRGWTIYKLHLIGYGADNITMDFCGSRYGTLEQVRVWGDQNDPPYDGIVLSKTETRVCSHFHFIGTTVDGYFLQSALHLNSSEENYFDGSQFLNRRVSTDLDDTLARKRSWALIMDGAGAVPIPSKFQTPSTARASFTVNRFSKCTIQKPFGIAGPTMLLHEVASVSWESCYITAGSSRAIEWWLTSDFIPYRIYMDFQIETSGIDQFIFFRSNVPGNFEILGLECSFGNVFCDTSMFGASGNVTTLAIKNFFIKLYRMAAGVIFSNNLFADRSKFKLINGDIIVPREVDFTSPATGGYGEVSNVVVKAVDNNSVRVYEPQWEAYTAEVSGFTRNNGTMVSRFRKRGRTVQYYIRYTIGNTDVIAGTFSVSLPVAAQSGDTGTPRGTARLFDSSAGTRKYRFACHSTATTVFVADADDVRVGAATPWAWAVGDVIEVLGMYEANI